MADLSSKKWVRYEPSIPGNAELPEGERFYLEVQAGLSVLEYSEASKAFFAVWESGKRDDSELGAKLAAPLERFVRFGKVPLTLNGAPVTDLATYLQAFAQQIGAPLVVELIGCFGWHNSYEGQRVVFSVRSFGGPTGTAAPKTEQAENQTAAR